MLVLRFFKMEYSTRFAISTFGSFNIFNSFISNSFLLSLLNTNYFRLNQLNFTQKLLETRSQLKNNLAIEFRPKMINVTRK